MLEKFKEQKQVLFNQYDKIMSMQGLFPIERPGSKPITIKDIAEKKEQLDKEHFIVSVTGQIKAGKSTLLNALIFKDEILPSDDTPHTAKLTLIKYGEKARIEVAFYNTDEWNELKISEYFKDYIEPEVEKAYQKGVFAGELIQSSALIKEDTIENLKEYVSKNGLYQPFVNTVTVYYPSEVLKEIIVVDTPGTNDPNPARDRIAKEWIKRTNANIYLIYAGQAFQQEDIDFIDNYLITIPANLKLTVINKIDTVENINSLKSWIKDVADSELKNREIYTSNENIVLVSALGALINEMDKAEKNLTPELEEYADMLDENDFLNPEKHGLDRLKRSIEIKLIETKGANIISTHRRYIDSLFEIKIKNINLKIESEKSNLNDLSKDIDSIGEMIKTIEKIRSKFENEMSEIVGYVKYRKSKIEDKLVSRLEEEFFAEVKRNIETEINMLPDNKEAIKGIIWKIKDEFGKRITDLRKILDETENEIKNEFIKKVDDLRAEMTEINKGSLDIDLYLESVFSLGSAFDIVFDIDRMLNRYFTEDLVENVMTNYKKWFGLKTDYGNIKGALKNVSLETINKIKSIIIESKILERVNNIVYRKLDEIRNKVQPFLEAKREKLKKLQANYNKKEEILREIKDKISKYEEQKEKIEILQKEVKDG